MNDHPFSEYLRILGKGPKSKRSLTVDEAKSAIKMILAGQVTDRQLGAFLLLMRANGESVEELTGFVSGLREYYGLDKTQGLVDLDISAYAGKWRYPPYFLLSVKLLVESGFKVLLHGDSGQFHNRHYADSFLEDLGFTSAQSVADAQQLVSNGELTYLPLVNFAGDLQEILHLKSELGVRTVFNTAVKMLNPLNANCSMQGIFHKGVENLHHAAFKVNGAQKNLVFKGEGGEPEVRPDAFNRFFISNHSATDLQVIETKSLIERVERPKEWNSDQLIKLWNGQRNDVYGENTVITTAAAALMVMKGISYAEALSEAKSYWLMRNS